MPEGDAVLRTAQRLHRALAGHPLEVVDLRWGNLDGSVLRGRTTLEVVPRGKHLLHRVEGGWTLHSHLRMDGRWRTAPRAEVRPERLRGHTIRAVLVTDQRAAVGRSLGMLDLVPTRDEHRLVGHLGPDVLGQDWDEDAAVTAVLAHGTRAIGEVLLDQRVVAGLGTIFTAEPLFAERVNPWAAVDELSPDDVRRVVRRAQRLIALSAQQSRTVLTDDPREPTAVFGRAGRPCRRCGGPVAVAPLGVAPQERVLFHCPRCQGVPATASS